MLSASWPGVALTLVNQNRRPRRGRAASSSATRSPSTKFAGIRASTFSSHFIRLPLRVLCWPRTVSAPGSEATELGFEDLIGMVEELCPRAGIEQWQHPGGRFNRQMMSVWCREPSASVVESRVQNARPDRASNVRTHSATDGNASHIGDGVCSGSWAAGAIASASAFSP